MSVCVFLKEKKGFLQKNVTCSLFLILFFMIMTQFSYARLPYTYSFEKNGSIYGNRIISIEFEHVIEEVDPEITENLIYARPREDIEFVTIDPKISISIDEVMMNVTIEELDRDIIDYELVIEPGALNFVGNYSQLDYFILPFSIYDVEPGFASTFVNPIEREGYINKILKYNAPRDIMIMIPDIYFRNISTIHRYQGLIPEETRSPNLSNIDIEASQDVTRVDVRVSQSNPFNDLNRRLERHGQGVFNSGQAGLGAEGFLEFQHDIRIKAFDDYGRNLEKKDFKLKVNDLENDFTRDDYIDFDGVEEVFGNNYSLYEIMEDRTLLENIVSRLRVEELNRIGVYYKNSYEDRVVNVENDIGKLARALADDNIRVIQLGETIQPNSSLIVDRTDVVLEGFGSSNISFPNDSDGSQKVELISQDRITPIDMTLRNLSINGNLNVDVGRNGSAHIKNVEVSGTTKLKSGDVNSIVLEDFTSQRLIIENDRPMKIVFKGNNNIGSTVIDARSIVIIENKDERSFGNVAVESNYTIRYSGLVDFDDPELPFVQRYGFNAFATGEPFVENRKFDIEIEDARDSDYNLLRGEYLVKVTRMNLQDGESEIIKELMLDFVAGRDIVEDIELEHLGRQRLKVEIDGIENYEIVEPWIEAEADIEIQKAESNILLITSPGGMVLDPSNNTIEIVVPGWEVDDPDYIDLSDVPDKLEEDNFEFNNQGFNITFKEQEGLSEAILSEAEVKTFNISIKHQAVMNANMDKDDLTIYVIRPLELSTSGTGIELEFTPPNNVDDVRLRLFDEDLDFWEDNYTLYDAVDGIIFKDTDDRIFIDGLEEETTYKLKLELVIGEYVNVTNIVEYTTGED